MAHMKTIEVAHKTFANQRDGVMKIAITPLPHPLLPAGMPSLRMDLQLVCACMLFGGFHEHLRRK